MWIVECLENNGDPDSHLPKIHLTFHADSIQGEISMSLASNSVSQQIIFQSQDPMFVDECSIY